jgi:KipI family sensor histidine kinase inhibitor
MRIRPYGPVAWLAEGMDDPVAWAAGVRTAVAAGRLPEVLDVIPAEASVVVTCARDVTAEVGTALAAVAPQRAERGGPVVTIDVVYDGPDLAAVAAAVGCTAGEVVARHVAGSYRVAFCGFSPGFAYLTGLDPLLHLPRRASPRPSVPAGAVAIAAHYSAVYPAATPGGWHVLGQTGRRVWDIDTDPPATLTPGTVVRFRSLG